MADFIVNDITPRVQYTAGGGSPTVFSYAFPIFEDTDLNVYLTPVGVEADDTTQLLTYNIDYTVTNSTPPTVGGFITLTVGATLGDVITIVRNQPYNRLDNYVQGGLFLATSINTDFDKTVFMSQQDKMYDRVLSPHYNVSGQPAYPKDILLPVLDANETWVMNNAGTQITTYDISGGGGGVVNSATGTANRIDVTPSTGNIVINISASYVGQNSITTLGTITTGTWNGTAIGVAYGGTNITSYTLGDTLYASGATTLVKLAGNITTAKQYLSQTGTGVVSAAPIWSTIDGGDITGAALTKVDDTNVTLTLGGTPATALLRATSLTLGWTGQLAVTRGGTGLSSTTINQLLYSSANNVIAGLATANSATLVTNSTGVPAWTASMTDGQVVVGSTGNTPAPATLTAGTNMSIVFGAGTVTFNATGGGSGEILERDIAQVAHGFAVGDIVYLNTTTYTLAIATSAAASEAVGIVSAVADTDNFTLCYGGHVTGLSGLTAGEVYFLSASSAGDLTTTPPSTVGQYVKPLLIADTTTSGYFFNMRGNEVTANAGVPAATQAEQETATSTVTYVSPGRQQFHPSASKAWALFNGTGTPALSSSYNITSITDNGAGDYTLNFTTAFSTANFSVSGTTNTSTSGAAAAVIVPGTWAVGSIRFTVRNSIAGSWAPGDETQISIQCFGDQ